jgi:citrate synthase
LANSLTAAEAARRLGVKPATLYAYVSRGVLSRHKAADGRGSQFDADEIERLARRGRPRRPAGTVDITLESAITEITADSLRFRGFDVTRLAVSRSFEEIAELLWTGEFQQAKATRTGTGEPWRATTAALAVGRGAQAVLPAGILPLERLQVIVPAIATTDALRLQLDQSAVLAAGRNLIAGMVDCLPAPPGTDAAAPASASGSIAERLWSRLADRRPSPGLLRALSAALVLLADHELAASTLAVRAAASVRADPYAVVGTGLGAMSGTLHGGASLGAETLLAAARGPADVPRVVGELLRRGEKVPGFGHFVYRGGDPRALTLLGLVRRAAPKSGQLAVAEAVLAEMRQKSLPAPNIDFAVATLARVAGMITGAGEAIFAVSRTAGWIAHALEAYTADNPLRPRAVYTGRPAITEP